MPLHLVRRLVSGQKKRFQDGGFDLDLAYITPRVIAMGLPAQGKEVLYRNPMQEISRFLHTYHSRHAKVYNLCSEHSYSAAHLQHPVALQQYPYDDHQTPPLAMVQQFCIDAAAWLAADPANVVVVHCKAGKGRTGIMICCLLLYLHKNAPDLANLPLPGDSAAATRMQQPASHSAAAAAAAGADLTGQQQQQQQAKAFNSRLWHPWQVVPPLELRQLERPVQDVLDMYAERRTHDGNGVTIKSQRRYVGYFWAVLCSGPGPVGALPTPVSVQLRQVTVCGLPPGTADSCVLVVEARPSGSLAPRASRVCARSAPGALSGSLTGLCMVPCAHVPLVQEDSCCSISSSPHGDTLTFRMPAASMGLSPLPLHSSSTATRTASAAARSQVTEAAPHRGPAGGADSFAAGRHGCCVCCGAPVASSCACSANSDALPGAVPAGQQPAAALAAAGASTDSSSSCAGGLADDSCWDASEQAGCCVVEGDVRLVVLKGTTRLFYTWFNTAFLPTGGCYTLTRSQLDKPSKTLPLEVTLTVRYVDMQPTATEAAESGHQQHQQGADGQQEHKQAQSKPWLHSFEEPSLETSRKGGKGSAQQLPGGAKKQQGAGTSMLAHAGVGTAQAAAAGSFGSAVCTDAKAQPAAIPGTQQQQRVSEGCVQPVPVSSSAPASPQDRRLQGSGSWRQHLPAISSISTSALLWGVPAPAPGAGQQRTPPTGPNKPDSWPGSWCGSAGRSWDWDTLAAAEDGAGWSARSGGAAPAAAGSSGPAVRDASQPGARGGSSGHSKAGSAGAAALPSPPQPWRRALLPGRERASSSSSGSKGTRISQDLHSSAASRSSRVVPALLPSQASIELPVIVKRPSGVDSLVDALLDPEHSASSQSALSAATAAAAASGKLLASEASSSAAAVTGAKPPAQLRKGYSWHGASSGSWFSAAVAAGSRGGSRRSSNSSCCSHTEARTLQQQQQQQQQQQECPYADAPAAAALEASVLDLDPLLLSERSGEVPGSVLSSFDPLQGLLEALNWGADVQRYQQPSTSTSTSARTTSSEPSSPRRGARVLPTVLSSPQLQPTRSAPTSPVEPEKQVCPGAQDVQAGRDTATPAEQSSRGLWGRSGPGAAGPGHSAWLSGRGPGSRSGGNGSGGSRSGGNGSGGSSSRRRPQAVRPDVCRLLDLEDWAEDEAEGLEGGDSPDAGAPAAAASGKRAAATGSVARSQSPQGKGGFCAAVPGAPSGAAQGAAKWAVGLRRRSSEDAAADADVPVPPPTPVKDPKGAATRVSARRSPAVGWRGGSSSSSGRAAAAGDESRLGLLAAEGRVAPSCAAEAPAVQQQWQQLEKAWQKSWWV